MYVHFVTTVSLKLPYEIKDSPGIPVHGLTTNKSNTRLLVCHHDPNDPESRGFILQYDISDSSTLTPLPDKTIRNIPGLVSFIDIVIRTDSNDNSRIYISDHGKDRRNPIIHVLDLSTGEKISQFKPDEIVQFLSINQNNNLLVTCHDNKLLEYDCKEHLLIRQINLPADMKYSWHAIQLTRNQFVVCQGYQDSLHRVCLVECSNSQTGQNSQQNAVIKHSYGGTRGSAIEQLNEPCHLAVDKNGFIFVADCWNHRIIVLNSLLEFSHLVKVETQRPLRLHLDESRDRIYVGEWGSGRVLILKLNEEESKNTTPKN